MMKIAIVGLGWLGSPLAANLSQKYEVVGSRRQVDENALAQNAFKQFPLTLPINTSVDDLDDKIQTGLFDKTDVLVITLPASRQPEILANYFTAVDNLVDYAIKYKIKHVIFTSSTSVYGSESGHMREEQACNPVSGPGKVLVDVEQNLLTKLAGRITILRLSGLAGKNRHPGRFFSRPGMNLSQINGQDVVNFVHGDDVIAAIALIISYLEIQDDDKCEVLKKHPIFNLAAPIHPSKSNFYAFCANLLNLPSPQFGLLKDEKVMPNKQICRIIDGDLIRRELGFYYSYPNPFQFCYE